MNEKAIYLITLLGGILYSVGFPTIYWESLFITTFFGFAIFVYSNLQNISLSKRIIHLILFLFCINYIGFYWISHTLREFGGLSTIPSYLLSFLFSFVVAPQYYFFSIILRYTQIKILNRREFDFHQSLFFILSIIFTMVVYYTPMQFAFSIGQIWMVFGENLRIAPYGGLPFYNFISYLIAFSLFFIFKYKKFPILLGSSVFILLISHLFFPQLNQDNSEGEVLNLRIVQANIGNFLKLESEDGNQGSIDEVLERYKALSTQKSNYPIDLIIWPETSYPFSLKSYQLLSQKTTIPTIFQRIIQEMDAELLIGGYDRPTPGSNPYDFFMTEYNSAFHIDRSSYLKGIYHKRILLPFGETLPFGRFNKFIGNYIPEVSFFGIGNQFTSFTTDNGISFITPICYEILKPEFMRDFVNSVKKKPQFILNLTNDSWYGDTSEPKQHLFLAKWRALELNLPLVRSTNTGITSIIYPDSSETARLELYEQKTLDLQLKIKKFNSTSFLNYGIYFNFIFWIPLILAIYFIEKRFNPLSHS